MKRYAYFILFALLAFNWYSYGDVAALFFATFSTKKAVFFGTASAYAALITFS